MTDIRHPGAAPDDIEKDFDVVAPVRTHSPGSDAGVGLRAILPQAQSRAVRPALGARSAMEVTLSRKRAKTQTRGRKLHSTEAKARVARARKTRTELEQELKACRRETAHARERLAEATMQQTASSEMLRLISNAPIQSVLDKVAEHAARLCDASNVEIFRLEDNLLRLAASYGEIPVVIHAYQGVPVNRDTVTGRAACDCRTIHVHDLAAEEGEYPIGSGNAKREGHRTTLGTPLLREGVPIGIILVRRREVRPFSNQQTTLIEAFADQAVIAIENARLFEAEKQHTLALANANRDLAEREAKIRRLVESNIIGIFIWDFDGRILEANDDFLRMMSYDREDLVAGRIRWADLTPPDWRDRNNARIERQKSGGRFEPFEKEYTKKDGSRVPVLIGGATFEEGGNQGVAFVFDLTERKRLEERLRVQYTIAQILAEAATIEEATPRILRAMGECLGWDVGALWRVDREAEVLRCVELWHKASIEVPEFERVSREFAFGPGLGLPGRVWSSLEPEYIPDVAPDENFPRAPIAEREGLRAAFGFPIMLAGEVLGVIEFFSREIRQPDRELLNVLATIGSQIGQFIERKRAEAALRDSERSLRSAIDGIAGLVAIMAPNGELDALNRQVIDYFGRSLEEMKNWGTNDVVHPDDLPRIAEIFQRSIAIGTPFHYELRLRRFDGEYRWFDNRCVPIRENSGRIARWYMLGTDIEDRKRAEQALRRSEAYLAEAQRLSHTGSAAYNETEILYWSEEASRTWGFDPLQGIPSREAVWQRIHPDDLDAVNENVERGVREKISFTNEFRIILPDGTVKHIEANNYPVFSASEELLEIIVTGIDVTERKRAEQALRESEAHLAESRRELQATIDKIPALVASLWPNGERDFVNLSWQRFTGISQEEARGTTQMIPVHPDHRGLDASHWQRCLETGEPFEQEEQLLRVDGQYRWHWVCREPARDENGKVIKWYGIGFDIEDRKRAEDALRESEAKFRDYAETASDWYWEIGPDYKFTLLTENAFRSNSADRIGTLCWDHALDLETESEKWRLVLATLDSRKPFRDFVYCSVDGSGSPMYVRVSGKPVFDANGEFRGYRGTGTDVTALRTAEAEARESERRYREAQLELAHANRVVTMGQLTASITHEVNQPITAAVTYALAARRFLSAAPPNFYEVDDALSRIVKEGNRAGEVVGRIRALIKKAPSRKDAVEINDAILEVITLTRMEAENNSVSVRTQLVEGAPRLQGDRVQLQQVMLNLILNAIEAMRDVGEEERELLISTRNEPDGVSVEVRDSGPGFAPAALERVFEAFYTTKPGGLGLGLSICRSIIEAHNGRLWASPNVPRGAIFGFIAPAHPAAAS
jgi:PAS domain S-box-containing protein